METPDEISRSASLAGIGGGPSEIDLMDGLMQYRAGFGHDPPSWRHYQYGLAYLGRAATREVLRIHEAVNMTNAKKEQHREWVDEMRSRSR